MDGVNKTLYIPLYGKAYVSKKGIILDDKKAEEIWAAEGFVLKGKSKSKWLAYYMGMRSAVFDSWLKDRLAEDSKAVVIHIGCGMDSRVIRVGKSGSMWYDVDFPDVIEERKRYYTQTEKYRMLCGDARECGWLDSIKDSDHAVVVMEGVSMYLTCDELRNLMAGICNHFDKVSLLVDCYTVMAAKMSKYKNPINDVGVTEVYGIDDPKILQNGDFEFVKEHNMTPKVYIEKLSGFERFIFAKLFAGGFSKKMYRMFEYKK